ncbi:hypothetical protein VKT23_000868 [Stygiomarasmius scandens]|uniref:Uncharacterized protein n=1 Tax=Marasmiellus scandens TaxID=2682957 RepID=A0ABR1KAR3_9AGAR
MTSQYHMFGYCKSTRAKCHGQPPCKGSPVAPGTLRYGKITPNQYGSDKVEWMHWGCVTSQTLAEISSSVENISGFKDLKLSDQQKIRRAIVERHVDPADIPATARKPEAPRPQAPPVQTAVQRGAPIQASTSATQASTGQNKRKAQDQALTSSQAPVSQVVDVDDPEDNAPEEAIDELYCCLNTNVVGLQYYKGLVGPGEEVLLIREPSNPYDVYVFNNNYGQQIYGLHRNAIQVKNIGRTQVGHVPRNVAAKLAPLMDQKLVNVEGVMRDGNLSGFKGYTLKMTVKIYGSSEKRAELEPKLIWATPGQRGFQRQNASAASSSQVPQATKAAPVAGPSGSKLSAAERAKREAAQRQREEELRKAGELSNMLKTLEKKDDDERRSSLLDTVCSVEDILNLPEYPSPPGIQTGDLKVDLLRHQKQCLKWCIDKEYPKLPAKETDKPVQFWEMRNKQGQKYYFNTATKTPQTEAPLLGRGSIVADAMGLGKTLTMLALILATKKDVPRNFSKATLVVVPLSVLSNWEKQIEDHCFEDSLSYCTYYGNSRSQFGAAELAQYDVVFTTYQTVTGEHEDTSKANPKKKKKMEHPLFEVKWKRVILDEGHSIRNPKTKMAKAACGLEAQRRWVVSGTPIINSVRDLGSLLSFLQICRPLDNPDFFNRLLLRPLKNGDYTGVSLLKTLMNEICIRRTKDMQDSSGKPLVPLPPVEMVMVPVALNPEARTLYDQVQELSQQRFHSLLQTNNRSLIQSSALALLTRLRQLALHPGLLPPNYLEQLDSDGTPEIAEITPEVKEKLQDRLAQFIEDSEECPICLNPPNDPKITRCAHIFCFECIQQATARDSRCPNDRRPLNLNELLEPRPAHEATQFQSRVEENDTTNNMPSAKIEQLINLLRLTPGGEKSLVFSQFTIAEALTAEGIPFVRFDGQMSAAKRQAAIARFSIPLQKEKRTVSSASQASSKSQRSRKASRKIVMDEEDGDDDDDDFVAPVGDDDDDFDMDMDDTKGKKKAKGKGKQKSLPESDFDEDIEFDVGSDENPAVMLISLKAGALGLNLTVANNVYLMDPWWQEGIESQAIDRVNRIGQTKNVHVYQLISENTVESKVLDIQERKKKLIAEAFSGRAQTQTQKREARMQEIMELLGARQQEVSRLESTD